MRYRHRAIEPKLKTLAKHFPVVVVTGARQVGKSTLLAHLFGSHARIVIASVEEPLLFSKDVVVLPYSLC